MAQVRKFKSGADLNSLKSQVDAAYQTASPEVQAKMQAIATNYQRYQAADPMRSRDAERLEADAYQRMLDIAAGGQGYSATNAGFARSNIFGYYDQDEVTNIGNEITKRTLSQPAKTTTTITTTGTSGSGGNYNFKWNRGLDTDYFGDDASLSQRATVFVDSLRRNLAEAVEAKEAGKLVRGVDKKTLGQFQAVLNALNSADFQTNTWQDPEVVDKQVTYLKRVAQRLKIPFSDFAQFFGEWCDDSNVFARKKALKDQGFSLNPTIQVGNTTLADILKDQGINVAIKGSDMFAYDKDWNLITSPISKIFDDQDNANTYGLGIFTDASGKLVVGDLDNFTAADNPWSQQVTDALNKIKTSRNAINKSYDFDDVYGYSDNDLVNQVYNQVGGSFNYADISAKFNGTDPVIVVAPTGKKIEFDRFGNVKNDAGLVYYYRDANGELKQVNSAAEVAQGLGTTYNYQGFAGETGDQVSNRTLTVNGDSTLTGDEDFGGDRTWWKHTWRGIASGAAVGAIGGGAGSLLGGIAGGVGSAIAYALSDNINEDPENWFNMMCDIITNPNGDDTSKYINMGYTQINNRDVINAFNGITNIVPFMAKLLREGDAKITPENRAKWRTIVLKYNQVVSESNAPVSNKQGGMIKKADKGEVLDFNGNPIKAPYMGHRDLKTEAKIDQKLKTEKEAAEAGEDITVYEERIRKPSKDLKTSDLIRLGAIAADVLSIPTAWVKGYGSAASALLGGASSIATLVADVTEDGLQFRDLTGFGANLVMSAAGAITGVSQIPKIAKSLVKYAPLCFSVWDGVTNGEQYAEAFKKLTSNEKMTVQDWKTLGYGLSLVAGLNRAGASAFKTKTIRNNAKLDELAKSNKNEMTLEFKDKNGKTISKKLSKADLDELAKKDNAADVDEFLKNKFGEKEGLTAIRNKRGPFGWFGKSKKNPYASQIEENRTINPNGDVAKGAMLSAAENSVYATGPRATQTLFGFAVNKIGKKRKLASDLDIATDNVAFSWLGPKSKGTAEQQKYIQAYDDFKNAPANSGGNTSGNTAPVNSNSFDERGKLNNNVYEKLATKFTTGSAVDPKNKNFRAAVNERIRDLRSKYPLFTEKQIRKKLYNKKSLDKMRADWNAAHPDNTFHKGGSLQRLQRLQAYKNNLK